MSKKHKIAKKEAQAQKKLYEEEVFVENLENEKVKEVESGVIQTSDDSVSSPEENNEIVVEEEPEKTENVGVKNEGEDVSSKKSKDKNAKVEDKTDNKNKKDNKKKKDKKNIMHLWCILRSSIKEKKIKTKKKYIMQLYYMHIYII